MTASFRSLSLGALCATFLSIPGLAQVGDDPLGAAPRTLFWWSDHDGDGLSDAFAVPPGGAAVLLANRGDGSFEDVTERVGLGDLTGVHQALWQDLDGDALPELFTVVPGGTSRLLKFANGAYVDVSARLGLGERTGVLRGEWRDVDADGAVDLHLSTERGELLLRNLGRAGFQEIDLGLAAVELAFSERLEAWTADPDRVPPLPPGAPTPDAGSASRATAASTGVTSAGTPGSAAASPFCFDSIEDQATMGCLTASSTPTVGALYPLGVEFNIDGSGRVGIGTLAPGTSLDVVGSVRASGQLISTAASGAPLVVGSSDRVDGLNADLLDGFTAADFSQLGSSIQTSEIEDGAVTSAKILDGTIAAADLAVGSVGAAAILDDSITSVEIVDSSIVAADLGAGSVGSSEIIDGSIGQQELAADSVGSAQLQTSSVAGAEILDGSITALDLAANSVGSSEIAFGAIFDSDVSASAGISGTKIDPSFGGQHVSSAGTGTFGGSLVSAAVTGNSIVSGNRGYLGVFGTDNYDGFTTANWNGWTIGAAGISSQGGGGGNFGLLGHSNGTGIRAEHATTGAYANLATDTYGADTVGSITGVRGRSWGGTGVGFLGFGDTGVVGVGTSTGGQFGPTNTFDGLRARTLDPNGYGALAANEATSGAGIGLRAETNSTGGRAIDVESVPSTGTNYGVYSRNRSSSGRALFAYASAFTGTTYGLRAENESSSGRAIFGAAYSPSGFAYGVYGTSESTSGRGVRGETFANTGVTYGVMGRSWSPNGFGIISFGSSGATGQKNFIQPHPDDPSREIRFTSLEGNESGTYFRGSGTLSGGTAVIVVPEEFRLVSEAEGVTVSLTAMGPGTLWVESKDLDAVVVRGTNDVAFDYMVNGVRRGWADYQAVHANQAFVPEQRGVPFGTQYPPAFRQLLVRNGILNADFTPNEATAAALGWELEDPEEAELARELEQSQELEHRAARAEAEERAAEQVALSHGD